MSVTTKLRELLDQASLRLANRILGRMRRQKAGDDPYHRAFAHFRQMVQNTPEAAVLEIGSRNVSGLDNRANFPGVQDYVGVDIHAGEYVDVVADAHQLSNAFPANRFDFVFSISVFEHLMFPWKAVLEINSILKPGGHVFVATHPTWPPHELPWDFWRYLQHSAQSLFNPVTGFELILVTEGLPARMFSLAGDPAGRTLFQFPLNQGIAIIARKIADYDRERLRWDLVPADVSDTMYPKPG